MKVVVIEDERLAAEDLVSAILDVDSSIEIVAVLASVTQARDWFHKNESPDLIFSDIELGDGQSFDVLKELSKDVPVIFCTAYDE